MTAIAGLVAMVLAPVATAQRRDDFANACAPAINLSTMTRPPGETGRVVRRLQTIAAGIATENVDLIVSAYAKGARIHGFPRLLPEHQSRGASGDRRDGPLGRDQLGQIYRTYFRDVPEAAVVFTRVGVSVKGSYATASAHARFVLPPGSKRDTYNGTVTWKLSRQGGGWEITEEHYQE